MALDCLRSLMSSPGHTFYHSGLHWVEVGYKFYIACLGWILMLVGPSVCVFTPPNHPVLPASTMDHPSRILGLALSIWNYQPENRWTKKYHHHVVSWCFACLLCVFIYKSSSVSSSWIWNQQKLVASVVKVLFMTWTDICTKQIAL